MAMVGAPTPGGGMQSSMRLARSQQSFNQSLHTDLGSSSSSSSSPSLPPMQPLDGVELSAGAKALVRRHAQLLSGVINSSSSFSMESPSSSSSKQQQQQQIEHTSTTIHPHTMRVSPVHHMTNTDVDYYNEGAIGGSENGGTGNDSLNESSFLRVSNSDDGHTQSRSRQQQQQQQSAHRVPGIRPTNNYATGSSSSSSSSSSLNQKTHPNQTSSSTRQGNTSSGNLVSVSHAAAVASASAVAVDTNRNNNSMRDGVGNNGSIGGDRNIAPSNTNEPPSRPDVRAAPYDMVPATNEQRSTGSSSSSSSTSNTSNSASSSSSSSSSTSTMTAPQFFKLLKARVSPSNLETLMASLSVFNQGSISKGELLSIAERTLAPDPLRMTVAPEIASKFTQAELTSDLTEVFKRLILRSAS